MKAGTLSSIRAWLAEKPTSTADALAVVIWTLLGGAVFLKLVALIGSALLG